MHALAVRAKICTILREIVIKIMKEFYAPIVHMVILKLGLMNVLSAQVFYKILLF